MAYRQVTRLVRLSPSSFVAVLALGVGPAVQADDMVRCQTGSIVRVGMGTTEVAGRCGEPKSKTAEEVPVRVRNQNGVVGIAGYTRVERWTYDRGYGQFQALLTFEDGELKSIELLTRP